ncbi:MFS transporter [Radiobacillus kanasensis]|uniref:MFS transporter n=1 Tax=Radiobacillus kanasensis TaxID=2844358 RepID=UPI001E3AE113|nr:MFS transporter [Radiobacillus kanasensis]UFU00201.1 MFS transporter [Radiobacillus kanasensis]
MRLFEKYNVLLIAFIFFTGIMGTRPLIPLLSSQLGASVAEIGIIVALYPFLPFFLAIKMGQIVDRVGYKRPIVASTFVGALAIFLPFISTNLGAILLSQILAGISHTVFAVSSQTLASAGKSHEKRDKSIMLFSIGVALGSFMGPMLGGLFADIWDYAVAFGILSGVSLLSGCFSLFIQADSHVQTARKSTKVRQSLSLLKIKNIRIAFLVSILTILGKDIYTAYFPLLGVEFGLSDSTIGLIISLNAAGGILIRWLIPYLLSNFSRTKIIMGSIVVSGIFFLALPFFKSAIILGVLSFIIGLGAGLGQPLSISTTADSLPQDRIGEGLGLRLTANRLTQISAPIVFGAVAHIASVAGVFFIVGLLTVFGGMKAKVPDA